MTTNMTRKERADFFTAYQEMKNQMAEVKAEAARDALQILTHNREHEFTPTELANAIGLPVPMLSVAVHGAARKYNVPIRHGQKVVRKTFVEMLPDGTINVDNTITLNRKQYFYGAK